MIYYYFPTDCNGQTDKSGFFSTPELTEKDITLKPEHLAKTHPERCCKFWRGHFLYESLRDIYAAQSCN